MARDERRGQSNLFGHVLSVVSERMVTSDASISHRTSLELGRIGALDDATLSSPISRTATFDTSTCFCDKTTTLRGLPLATLLDKWTTLLQSPKLDSQFSLSDDAAESLYASSQKVSSLSWFISHSWRAQGWKKRLALVWFLNRRVAVRVSFFAAGMWSIISFFFPIRMQPVLPIFPVASAATCGSRRVHAGISFAVFAVVFVAVLLSNPMLSKKARRDTHFFLDRACIHQTDPVLKEAGIRSLGAFIKNSDRMLVFWSDDYFSRLWCNYEIATFASLHGVGRIDVVPLYVAMFGLLITLAYVATRIFRVFAPVSSASRSAIMLFPVCLCHVRALRWRLELFRQIGTFSLADSKCFCCSVGHRLPDGASIPCDRAFVVNNVNRFLAEPSEDESDGVEAFERFVREVLGKQVRFVLGPFGLPLSTFQHFCCMHFFYLLDLILLNADVELAFHWFVAFHMVFDASLFLSIAFLAASLVSWLHRFSFVARGRAVVDIILCLLIALYIQAYTSYVVDMSETCFADGFFSILISVLVLLLGAMGVNYKLAWEGGSLEPCKKVPMLTFMAGALHVLVPIVLCAYETRSKAY